MSRFPIIDLTKYHPPTRWDDIDDQFKRNEIYYYKINNVDVRTVPRLQVFQMLAGLFLNGNIHSQANDAIDIEFAVEPGLAAVEVPKSGGTRKIRRHHSYPLKHTFKNRRA